MTITIQQWLDGAVGRLHDWTSGVGNGLPDCADVASDIVIATTPGGRHLWANGIDCAAVAAATFPAYWRLETFSEDRDYPPGSIFSGGNPPYGHTGVLTRPVDGVWWAIQQDTFQPDRVAWEGPVLTDIQTVAVPTDALLALHPGLAHVGAAAATPITSPEEDDMPTPNEIAAAVTDYPVSLPDSPAYPLGTTVASIDRKVGLLVALAQTEAERVASAVAKALPAGTTEATAAQIADAIVADLTNRLEA